MGSVPSYDTMAKRSPKKAARKGTARKGLTGPRVVVVPPGPKSKAALERQEKFITKGLRVGLPIELTRAEGPFVQDADGNVYVDLGVGIGVHNAGHRPPAVTRAAKAQLDKLTHICYMVATYKPYTDLAEVLAEICPPGLTQSLFLNSGSEAVENAVKIARAATGRAAVIASNASATWRIRASFGISSPMRRSGYPDPLNHSWWCLMIGSSGPSFLTGAMISAPLTGWAFIAIRSSLLRRSFLSRT